MNIKDIRFPNLQKKPNKIRILKNLIKRLGEQDFVNFCESAMYRFDGVYFRSFLDGRQYCISYLENISKNNRSGKHFFDLKYYSE